MRTTLNLDPDLLAAAMKATQSKTKTDAIHAGLRALLEKSSRRRLAALRGEIPTLAAPSRRRSTR